MFRRQHQANVSDSDSEDDQLSESGLGDSPDDDLIDEESDNNAVDNNEEQEDESDSSPEDVRSSMHQSEPERIQAFISDMKKKKTEQKEQRKKKDALFKMQKQEKIAALMKRKLPEECLENLASSLAPASSKKAKTGSKETPLGAEDDSGSGDEGEEEEDDFDLSGDEGQLGLAEDFIPLDDSQTKGAKINVISLEAEKRTQSGVPQKLADFKKSMLYGTRHKRMTSHQAKQRRAKQKARR